MTAALVQEQCELGQRQLMEMEYLQAEATLAAAERAAWDAKDWDALARLYLPLQEARRQRRQRCGEGIVRLDLIATSSTDRVDGKHIVENFPFGQLLVAGWGTIAPALRVRELQIEKGLFVETFLAAVYPTTEGKRIVMVVPLNGADLPSPLERSKEELTGLRPPGSVLMDMRELPIGSRRGNPETYGQVMALWERLHVPFLESADRQSDSIARMKGYRLAIDVDYACELAHQKLSDVAAHLARR